MMTDNLNARIAALLNSEADRMKGLEAALGQILSDFQSETGTLHWLDAEKQLLQLGAQVGLPPQMLDVIKTIPVGKGIAGQTVAQNKPVTICNLQTDTSGVAKPGAKQTGVGGALCVPMHRDGKIIGTLGIGTRRQHEYTPEETQRLQDIANLIASHFNAAQ
ncbi:MAG TPA: GAF domain-containing protein [Verrucomicrobiae bacterium]|nr:GAF domain-containing protein [Verrucomicrobiae bacterium]